MTVENNPLEKQIQDIVDEDDPDYNILGGPNGKLPGDGSPKVQIKYLQGQLETSRKLLHEKQEVIDQLKEALKKTSFQFADQLPSPSVTRNEDIFNIVSNKAYVILR